MYIQHNGHKIFTKINVYLKKKKIIIYFKVYKGVVLNLNILKGILKIRTIYRLWI